MKTNSNYLMAILFSLAIFSLSVNNASAQYNWHWHFGINAGLDFSSGSPVATSTAAVTTNEGTASISDPNGNLLFYTDGVTVWDNTHTAMPNGTGLLGHSSSTQSATIVPYPGTSHLFYIITSDKQCGGGAGTNGVRYSLVDMTQAGNGSIGSPLGDVTGTKNVLLVANSIATEKVTTACHANGLDYWVITQVKTSGDIYAFHVSTGGLNTTPVINSGVATGISTCNEYVGQIKVSPDGTRLAVINRGTGPNELFDFNNSTAAISNLRQISNAQAYGLEFSPNSNVLYINNFNNAYQYDATQTTTVNLQASQVLLHTYNGTQADRMGSMQLGPDNLIYVANGYENQNGSTLDAVLNPDVLGAGCNYTDDHIALAGGTNSRLGLPGFVSCAPVPPCNVAADFEPNTDGCEVIFVNNSTIEPGLTVAGWYWTFGDGSSSTEQMPTHIYRHPGMYEVCLTVTAYNGFDCCISTKCFEIEIHKECDPCRSFEPSFTWEQDTICDTCTFHFYGVGPNNVAGWYWDFGDGHMGAGKNITHTFDQGHFNVCLTTVTVADEEGNECCTQTFCDRIICDESEEKDGLRGSGIINKEKSNDGNYQNGNNTNAGFNIYPNPANNNTTVTFELDQSQNVSLYITDMYGKEVKRIIDNNAKEKGSHQLSFDTEILSDGIYIITLKTGNKLSTGKLLINK